MASIQKLATGWRAQVRRSGMKSISKMCRTKAEAERWARDIESKMDGGLYREPSKITVKEIVKTYREMREKSGREVSDSSSEHYMLACLDKHLGAHRVERLEVPHLVDFAQTRRAEGAGPYTVNMDISKLGTVLRHAGAILNMRLPDVVGAARPLLHHLKLIGGGGKRDRRPTDDEMVRIAEWMAGHRSKTMRALPDVMIASAILGLRRGEVARIKWADFDESRRIVIVRDRKDPRAKKGNDQEVPLIGDSMQVILRQPRTGDRIFPYHIQTISKYFKAACDALSIPDLNWHDLRHEAASALADAGWTPHEIKAVTGHKKSEHLDRYVQMDLEQLAKKSIDSPRKQSKDGSNEAPIKDAET